MEAHTRRFAPAEGEQPTAMHVILEYPATPDETLALSMAFSDVGIPARLRAAPRRRANESSVWRVVIAVPLHELLVALKVPRAAQPATLQGLVRRVSAAWHQGPIGHIEVGPRGTTSRATGGVLLTPDLPTAAYEALVRLASSTLDEDRLFLWDAHAEAWSTFDVDVPVHSGSVAERQDNIARERVQGRFRRFR